jgi:putative tryptophan/tyrosine transport system substrate-binding protein
MRNIFSLKAGVLVTLVLSLLTALLLGAEARPRQVPRIGYLTVGTAASHGSLLDAFKHGLHELGWVEGQTIAIESRWVAGQMDRLSALAAELVRLPVDLIVTTSTPVSQAAKDATTSIPIVMAVSADPVGTGLVASLARPGGNITGMSSISPELGGKRLELLRELLPTLSRVAFLLHGGDPAHRHFFQEAQDAAERLGIQLEPVVIGSGEELDRAFAAVRSARAEALMVQPLFVGGHLGYGQQIADFALTHRLPTVSGLCEFVHSGGLLCYGTDLRASFRAAAVFVDKILKGAKPADLPVQQPTTFTLGINLKTAQALGLTVPPSLLLQADEVIK